MIYTSVLVYLSIGKLSDEAIYENNYKATKGAIEAAVKGTPSVDDMLAAKILQIILSRF